MSETRLLYSINIFFNKDAGQWFISTDLDAFLKKV
jgi:hypothetical protein